MREDIYERVTSHIYNQLEAGTAPWFRPWNAEHTEGGITRPLRHNAEPYKGINVLLLWGAAMENGFTSPIWLTFKQAQAEGAHVRKGERGSMVVYADRIRKTETGENGEEVEREIPFLKAYTVFNSDQIEGLSATFNTVAAPVAKVGRIEHAEAFFTNTGAVIRHGGNKAYYSPGTDHIQMPVIEAFKDREAYYETLAHEAVHWTKAPDRLNRDFGSSRFGNPAYATEEVVAELGSCYLAADLALEIEPREDHASYIANWLTAMKEDKRFIFTAASHASRAADFLHSLQAK